MKDAIFQGLPTGPQSENQGGPPEAQGPRTSPAPRRQELAHLQSWSLAGPRHPTCRSPGRPGVPNPWAVGRYQTAQQEASEASSATPPALASLPEPPPPPYPQGPVRRQPLTINFGDTRGNPKRLGDSTPDRRPRGSPRPRLCTPEPPSLGSKMGPGGRKPARRPRPPRRSRPPECGAGRRLRGLRGPVRPDGPSPGGPQPRCAQVRPRGAGAEGAVGPAGGAARPRSQPSPSRAAPPQQWRAGRPPPPGGPRPDPAGQRRRRGAGGAPRSRTKVGRARAPLSVSRRRDKAGRAAPPPS
ncbi:proline-rich protein 2-like [Eubalaena glacialis]|uniref:proline-rich protein 2-like n=1 Tax=Eubalaena glacialis TaxID=27606 RepID=UPI002A5A40D6|nr:proline-rich protein 2-like [Eubalaena glacialis]